MESDSVSSKEAVDETAPGCLLFETAPGCLLLIVGCLLLSFFAGGYFEQYRDERALPDRVATEARVEEQINALSLSVTEQMTDRLLVAQMGSVHSATGGLLAGCTTGMMEAYFGTSREFAEVEAEFREISFADGEWTLSPDGHAHFSEKGDVLLAQVKPNNLFYPGRCDDYPTCYLIAVIYKDPALAACSG